MDVKGYTFPNRVNYEGKQLLKRQRKSLKKLQSLSHFVSNNNNNNNNNNSLPSFISTGACTNLGAGHRELIQNFLGF